MQIFGPYRVTTPQQPAGPRPVQAAEPQQVKKSNQPVDQLDLSAEATEIDRLSGETPTVEGIRFEKVAEIRRQIADGAYESDEKLDIALERLLDEIA